jgi:hypothetical protein
MSDPIDDTIAAVQAELCRFSQCANHQITLGQDVTISAAPTGVATSAVIYYTIGAVAASELHGIPCISWIETGGKTDPLVASQDGKLFNDLIRLRLAVIAESKEATRLLWMNLRNAGIRIQERDGISITFGNQTSPSEEKASKCTPVYEIQADVDIALAVNRIPQQLTGFPVPLADYAYRAVMSTTDQTLDQLE